MEEKKFIFFDADDTLWENEIYFRNAEKKYCEIFKDYGTKDEIVDLLWKNQEDNIPLFGYGSKTYLIGMIDTAYELCARANLDNNTNGKKSTNRENAVPEDLYLKIKKIITDLAFHQVEVYDGVEETLRNLSKYYRMAVITKGDLTEQQYKFHQSGLDRFFEDYIVVRTKDQKDYMDVCRRFNVTPEEAIMVGNSVRSDIAPFVEIGGHAIYIPSGNTWVHELMDLPDSNRIIELKNITELCNILTDFGTGIAKDKNE